MSKKHVLRACVELNNPSRDVKGFRECHSSQINSNKLKYSLIIPLL
jgi:hypothetical protein